MCSVRVEEAFLLFHSPENFVNCNPSDNIVKCSIRVRIVARKLYLPCPLLSIAI